MEKDEHINRGSRASISINPHGGAYASFNDSPRPRRQASARTASQSLVFKSWSVSDFCIVLIIATTYFSLISAQSNEHFRMTASQAANAYSCSANLICLGNAFTLSTSINEKAVKGSLSLSQQAPSQAGIAYYYKQIRLLNRSTNRTASFSTSFVINAVYGTRNGTQIQGDGMTFVMSADNSTVGEAGGHLGIFTGGVNAGVTTSKSIVVEFDTYQNIGLPQYDINGNHVSFDFKNITTTITATNSDVVNWGTTPLYAWIDYNHVTKLLELRTSTTNERPGEYALSHTVNLADVVEEYMWVGFSSGTGDFYSTYYVGDWIFDSRWASEGESSLMIVGLSVASFVAVLLLCIFVALCGRARSLSKEDSSLKMIQIAGMPQRFSYGHLSAATRRFSEDSKLGQGGFGSVYRGSLPRSGIPVAVKKISRDSNQGEEEFLNEICIISQLRHRNLIQLLGWCKKSEPWSARSTKSNFLLVYELMPNGSLDKWLFDGAAETQPICLSWEQRLNILIGTAAALEYLHQGWAKQVIHRDIKSSNIMLDAEWNAKLGDFGLARLVDHNRLAATTVVAGTYGYIAPEAAATGRFTEKADVYAFGAVLLEVACGRQAFIPMFPEDEVFLVDWVWRHLSQGDLMSTVDRRLQEYDAHWMEVVLTLGLLCSHPDPLARPTMRQVSEVLAGEATVPSIPISRPAPVFRLLSSTVTSNSDSGLIQSSKSSIQSGDGSMVSSAEQDLESSLIQSADPRS